MAALQFGAGGDAHLCAVMLPGAPAVPVTARRGPRTPPARRRPSASSRGQTCRDKARLLAVEMGPWVPFQLSKQEQNPLSTSSARGPGALRPPVPSIIPRESRARCSLAQQHLWDLALVLPLAALGCGLRGTNPSAKATAEGLPPLLPPGHGPFCSSSSIPTPLPPFPCPCSAPAAPLLL